MLNYHNPKRDFFSALTGKGDPERGDILVDGPATWKFELTDLSIQLLTEQNGLFLVGDGYTVKKVTIE